jgi:pimeloyl-ACP methyl ester carboxylesterase
VSAEGVGLPGTAVVLGGRSVHLVEQQGSGPAVLLLGGCGVPYYAWDVVLGLLAERRVIRMDRPGLAGTVWPGRLPTLEEEIATLADLATTLGTPPIVVAHSMAGLHAEGLARLHPGLVAGLILVDSSVERRPRAATGGVGWRWLAGAAGRVMTLAPPTRALGSLADRMIASLQSDRLRVVSPRPEVQRVVFRSPDAVASVIAEQAAYRAQVADLARLRETTPWPDIAVRVLTAAGDGGASWVRAQAWLAGQLRGRHTVVADSRHLMMIDRPDVIVDAVRQMLPDA